MSTAVATKTETRDGIFQAAQAEKKVISDAKARAERELPPLRAKVEQAEQALNDANVKLAAAAQPIRQQIAAAEHRLRRLESKLIAAGHAEYPEVAEFIAELRTDQLLKRCAPQPAAGKAAAGIVSIRSRAQFLATRSADVLGDLEGLRVELADVLTKHEKACDKRQAAEDKKRDDAWHMATPEED